MTKFLNKSRVKKTGTKFTISDVQAYIRRGHLPKYMGGNVIKINRGIDGITLYNIKS